MDHFAEAGECTRWDVLTQIAKSDLKQNIALAGTNRLFYRADMQLKGENLIISNPQVPQPRIIRMLGR